MRKTYGIYEANPAKAMALADELRKAGGVARIRSAAMFTLVDKETFDEVYVDGDFPLVTEAYPDAKRFPGDEAKSPEPEPVVPVQMAQEEAEPAHPGLKPPTQEEEKDEKPKRGRPKHAYKS